MPARTGDRVAITSSAVPRAGSAPARRASRTLALTAVAVVSGFALYAAFPSVDLWWSAPLGVALLAVVVHQRDVWTGAWLGLAAGFAWFVPLLQWTALDARVGWWPWLLLALSQASFVAALGAAAAWCSRLVNRWRWSWPLVIGVLWVACEALRSRIPFGGFPWGRLAFSQADSPLAGLAALGGASLVTFGAAVTGALLAAGAWQACELVRGRVHPSGNSALPRIFAFAGATLLVLLSGLVVPYEPPAGSPVTVAVVQGNVPRLGLDFNAQRRAVLDNHVAATLDLARRVANGEAPRPDLVVWPENSSDIDPLRNPDAYQRIDQAADAIAAPILVGALLKGPETAVRNAGLVWLPERGPVDRYVKQHPVPFAEYLPMRPLVRSITVKADLVGNFVAGDRPGVLRAGPVVLGDVICFEVAYDNLVRDTVTGGAQLLVVQTNNATFNVTEARQQLAMVRLRAIEHGRPALMASTVGISAFVAADGTVSDASGFNTRHVAVRRLRLGNSRTLATRLGVLPELLLSLGAAGALVIGAARRRVDTSGTGSGWDANGGVNGPGTAVSRQGGKT
jgi:apolipoprotein N-acyltransferase